MRAKYFPGLFLQKYPVLRGQDWIRRVDTEDLQVFVDIGRQANDTGRMGGRAIVEQRGKDHMQKIGRIGAIATNSKKFWNRLLQDELYKLGL